MSFDEHPDGDIHGDEKLLVDTTMKMTVHAAHCNAMLVAALEGLEVPSVDFWIGRQTAEIRALTSAICTQAKMANELEQQIDACLPYLKEGETAAECLARNRADIARLMGKWGEEKMRSARLSTALNEILFLSTDKIADAYVIAGDALNPVRSYMEDKAQDAPTTTED